MISNLELFLDMNILMRVENFGTFTYVL